MDPNPFDDAWLERLAETLAAAFVPHLGQPKQEEWRRSLAAFLGADTLPAPEVLKWGSLDCDSAMRALTHWCGLGEYRAQSSFTTTVGGTVSERGAPRAPFFRRIETGPGATEACLAEGTVLLERDGERWALVVEYDDYPPVEVEVRVYSPPGRNAERDAFLDEMEQAVSLHRIGRGELLVYHQTGPRLLPRPSITWDDVVLDPAIREEVRRNVELPLAAAPTSTLPRHRSLLLSGPPGTGKTLIGKALAASLPEVSFLWVTPGGLGRCEDVSALFDWARERKPAIIFFEDLDLVVGSRGGANDSMLGEILAQLDGFAENDGVVVLATTNDEKVIDAALRRPGRFDRHLVVDAPAEGERRVMLDRFLGESQVDQRVAAVARLARLTAGLTGAHLQELVYTARLACSARSGEVLEHGDFAEALASLRLSRRDIGFALRDPEDRGAA
jgi:hypothetical protein